VPQSADVTSPAADPGGGVAGPDTGGYMVACGWMPPAVPAAPQPGGEPGTPEGASRFLTAISMELEARGLTVRPSGRVGIIAEIAVSSPVYPERGSVSIGYDGFMVWERWAPAAGSDRAAGVVRLIAWLLSGGEAPAPGSTT
jgi:hypothetical protein